MKADVLGLNHLLSFPATCHTVSPRSSALSSGHLRIAPPKSSSDMPRFFWYQAASAAWSPLLLKKTPPIPVILAIVPFLLSGGCARVDETHTGAVFHGAAGGRVQRERRLVGAAR